jgi:hypothetical protein
MFLLSCPNISRNSHLSEACVRCTSVTRFNMFDQPMALLLLDTLLLLQLRQIQISSSALRSQANRNIVDRYVLTDQHYCSWGRAITKWLHMHRDMAAIKKRGNKTVTTARLKDRARRRGNTFRKSYRLGRNHSFTCETRRRVSTRFLATGSGVHSTPDHNEWPEGKFFHR